MDQGKLYNVSKRYLQIIERIERTANPQLLADLEEERVIWHNKLLEILKREGIPFQDRDHVTRIAYYLVRGTD